MQLRFVASESTESYFEALRGYLDAHGCPIAFYSDKHSVFRATRQEAKGGQGMTQFGRALAKLNIEILCANSSQAKGRVERANRTLQDRLVKELRLAGVNDMAAGNSLLPGFVERYNQRFSVRAARSENLHRTLNVAASRLQDILCHHEQRYVGAQLTISYDRKQIEDHNRQDRCTPSHMRPTLFFPAIGLLLLSLIGGMHFHFQRMLKQQVGKATARQELLPKRVLWVWERPEDLREVDPASTGVAVLQETLHLGTSLTPDLRRQPVLMPEGISEVAVVRIETDQSFATHKRDSALLQSVVANLEGISRQPGISALQIDFDAKRSERAFYRELLRNLRQQMPATLPLDITALVSWCSTDDWISDLPINAATPMFFRMEPDRRRMPLEQAPGYQVHEPLCLGSVGVSTTEPWPHDIAGKRVFLFADHGWANDLDRLPSFVFNRTAFHSERP